MNMESSLPHHGFQWAKIVHELDDCIYCIVAYWICSVNGWQDPICTILLETISCHNPL